MGKVNLFPTITSVFPDTKLAGQTPGNGASPDEFQVELSTLLNWILDNITFPSPNVNSTVTTATTTYTIAAGKWLRGISFESTTSQTVTIGTTLGGKQIADAEAIPSGNPQAIDMLIKGATGGTTIYISGLSGTVKISFLVL